MLGLIIAHELICRFPDEPEGALSRRHAALVRKETLAEVALAIGVGAWVTVAPSEADGGGRHKPAILADTVEALIGALYLDGGMAPAEAFIRRHWADKMASQMAPPRDAKTGLQEWAQAKGMELPVYEVVATDGPAHAPRFDVVVHVQGLDSVRASGSSKRAAEQAAAAAMLATVGAKP